MRTYLLPLASLPFVAVGCFDRLSDDPQFDGGVLHFDGGIIDGSLPDGAAPVDASTADAPPADSGPASVKVVVLKAGLPESGVNVVFQDASGAVVDAKTTASDGSASRVVDTGSMVTIALGGGARPRLVTVMAVKPGDVLTALDDDEDPSHFDAIAITLPPNAPTGATSFQAHSGACTSPQTQTGPISNNISAPTCEHDGSFPVLTLALDANTQPVGFAFKKGNAIVQGTTQVSGLSAWATPSSVSISATNAPSTVSLGYTEIADGVGFAHGNSGVPTSGTYSSTFVSYPGYADAVQLEMGLTATHGARSEWTSSVASVKRVAPPASATSFDATQLLPAMIDLANDVADKSRPILTPSFSAAPTGADGLIAQLSWSSFDVDAGTVSGYWIIVAPPSATTVKAPSLPIALATWAPSANAIFSAPAALIFDSDLLPGYDQLRSVFGTFPAPVRFKPSTVLVPPLPTNGTLRVSSITESPM